jgi:DNA-binding XRE family transcriptional regulator
LEKLIIEFSIIIACFQILQQKNLLLFKKNSIFAPVISHDMDWNSLSNSEIIAALGKRIKNYRIKKRFTQQEFADRAGVSLFTVAQIEKGKPVSFSTLVSFLRVLRLLENFELLLPEIEISPIEMMKLQEKIPKRKKKKK